MGSKAVPVGRLPIGARFFSANGKCGKVLKHIPSGTLVYYEERKEKVVISSSSPTKPTRWED